MWNVGTRDLPIDLELLLASRDVWTSRVSYIWICFFCFSGVEFGWDPIRLVNMFIFWMTPTENGSALNPCKRCAPRERKVTATPMPERRNPKGKDAHFRQPIILLYIHYTVLGPGITFSSCFGVNTRAPGDHNHVYKSMGVRWNYLELVMLELGEMMNLSLMADDLMILEVERGLHSIVWWSPAS